MGGADILLPVSSCPTTSMVQVKKHDKKYWTQALSLLSMELQVLEDAIRLEFIPALTGHAESPK